MTRTTATLLVAATLLALFAWQAQSQPSQGFGPVFDPSNVALRVNVVAGAAGGLSASNFGGAYPTSGVAIGYKDALGSFASFTGANGRLNVIVGNESTLIATVTVSSSVLPTGAALDTSVQTVNVSVQNIEAAIRESLANFNTTMPISGQAIGFNVGGVMSSVSTTNRLPVTCDNCSSSAASFGQTLPTSGSAIGFKDPFGAMASVTGSNGKPNVIVGNESNMTATVTQTTAANLNARVDHSGATAAAVPTRASYIGGNGSGNLTGFIACDNYASISTANAGNYRLVASASGASIYVCGYSFVAGTTPVGVKFLSGRDDGSSGSACTGTVAGNPDLTGVMGVVASGGVVNGPSLAPAFKTLAGYGLCINLSNGGQVSGHLSYTRF